MATDDDAVRAAKLSRVPGVTIAEACKRFGVTKSALQKARKSGGASVEPSLAELALAALTSNGTKTSGTLEGLDTLASWIDHINRDGCTVADVERLLASLPEALSITGKKWKLVKPWP